MALMTVTAAAGVTLNDPAVAEDGVATSPGHLKNELPFPFGPLAGKILPTASKQLPVHPMDWSRNISAHCCLPSHVEWNLMVQGQKLTLAYAVETTNVDQFEEFIDVIG